MDVPARLAPELGWALAAQALNRAGLGARLDTQSLRAVQRRDLHLGAAQRLGDRQRNLDLQVVAAALEHGRCRDVGHQIQVAGGTTAVTGLALARQADAAAVTNTGGDVDAHALDGAHGARPVARRAGVLDDRPRAAAARAGLGDREHPLARDLDPAPFTDGADLRRRTGLGARAVAGRAGVVHRHGQRDLRAGDRLVEGDRDLRLEIAAALGTRAPATTTPPSTATPAAATKQVGEDVAHVRGVEVEVAEAAEAAAGTAAGGEGAGATVILLALVRVAEDVVGLGDLLETGLGGRVIGVAVGVVPAREFAVRLLDLLGSRFTIDPERLVVVGTSSHVQELPGLRRHDHARGSNDVLAEAVAGLVDLDDRAGGRPVRGWGLRCARHRLVQGRVEGLARGREGLDPHATQRVGQFRAHQTHALQQRVILIRGLQSPVEVVERGQQLAGELDHTALLRERGIARAATAVVLEVGLGALSEREVLVALGGDRDQLVEVALDLAHSHVGHRIA